MFLLSFTLWLPVFIFLYFLNRHNVTGYDFIWWHGCIFSARGIACKWWWCVMRELRAIYRMGHMYICEIITMNGKAPWSWFCWAAAQLGEFLSSIANLQLISCREDEVNWFDLKCYIAGGSQIIISMFIIIYLPSFIFKHLKIVLYLKWYYVWVRLAEDKDH